MNVIMFTRGRWGGTESCQTTFKSFDERSIFLSTFDSVFLRRTFEHTPRKLSQKNERLCSFLCPLITALSSPVSRAVNFTGCRSTKNQRTMRRNCDPSNWSGWNRIIHAFFIHTLRLGLARALFYSDLTSILNATGVAFGRCRKNMDKFCIVSLRSV